MVLGLACPTCNAVRRPLACHAKPETILLLFLVHLHLIIGLSGLTLPFRLSFVFRHRVPFILHHPFLVLHPTLLLRGNRCTDQRACY